MIKKIIACLTICFIITGFISPVFSDASALPQPNWSDPGISEIINISDLTGWMLNGGTYDVSTYTDAESFMNDYFSARTKTRLEGSDYQIKSSFGLEQQYYEVGDSAYAHDLDVNRVIASSFRDHSGYGRRFTIQVNEALLSSGNLYDTKIPLLNEIEFANFVGYNHDALRLYTQSLAGDPQITPTPDSEYVTICNNISHYVLYNQGSRYNVDFANCTYKYNIGFGNYNLYPQYPFSVAWGISNNLSLFTDVGTVYFTINNDNTVTASYDFPQKTAFLNVNGLPKDWAANVSFQDYVGDYATTLIFRDDLTLTSNNVDDLAIHDFVNLTTAMNYLNQYFRNINLYVNDVPWAIASIGATNNITPEFPDAVGGEELPTTTWPIFKPRAPYYTSVPGMLQAIEDAIADDGELDLDDLKPYLTDENGDPVPDPIFDPEPVPIPVPDPVNPDVVPGLPILPAIPPDMPGFNGVSVLAEIINFTNQSLPSYLIVTFWGIIFGIVILGLIKILHK